MKWTKTAKISCSWLCGLEAAQRSFVKYDTHSRRSSRTSRTGFGRSVSVCVCSSRSERDFIIFNPTTSQSNIALFIWNTQIGFCISWLASAVFCSCFAVSWLVTANHIHAGVKRHETSWYSSLAHPFVWLLFLCVVVKGGDSNYFAFVTEPTFLFGSTGQGAFVFVLPRQTTVLHAAEKSPPGPGWQVGPSDGGVRLDLSASCTPDRRTAIVSATQKCSFSACLNSNFI